MTASRPTETYGKVRGRPRASYRRDRQRTASPTAATSSATAHHVSTSDDRPRRAPGLEPVTLRGAPRRRRPDRGTRRGPAAGAPLRARRLILGHQTEDQRPHERLREPRRPPQDELPRGLVPHEPVDGQHRLGEHGGPPVRRHVDHCRRQALGQQEVPGKVPVHQLRRRVHRPPQRLQPGQQRRRRLQRVQLGLAPRHGVREGPPVRPPCQEGRTATTREPAGEGPAGGHDLGPAARRGPATRHEARGGPSVDDPAAVSRPHRAAEPEPALLDALEQLADPDRFRGVTGGLKYEVPGTDAVALPAGEQSRRSVDPEGGEHVLRGVTCADLTDSPHDELTPTRSSTCR